MTIHTEKARMPADYMPESVPGPLAQALIARDNEVIAPLGRVYPLVIDHAKGAKFGMSMGIAFST